MNNIRSLKVQCPCPDDWDAPYAQYAWHAVARFENEVEIERWFPYVEDGDYHKECEAQYEIESWLLSMAEMTCDADATTLVWYSVGVEEV